MTTERNQLLEKGNTSGDISKILPVVQEYFRNTGENEGGW
jgi:hypothetical protein